MSKYQEFFRVPKFCFVCQYFVRTGFCFLRQKLFSCPILFDALLVRAFFRRQGLFSYRNCFPSTRNFFVVQNFVLSGIFHISRICFRIQIFFDAPEFFVTSIGGASICFRIEIFLRLRELCSFAKMCFRAQEFIFVSKFFLMCQNCLVFPAPRFVFVP